MSDFRKLSEDVLASPQVRSSDIESAHNLGVRMIVNNRPDGEAEDQTPGAEIEEAARAAGIDYVAIPIGQGGFGEEQVRAMARALANAEGTVLAYCRTGTRSTLLWALAQAAGGADTGKVAAAAAAAGYDVTPVRPAMEMLSARARG